MLTRLSGGRHTHHLVCFPHAGGGPAAYRAWRGIDDRFSVWAVALPGRGRLRHEPYPQAWAPLVARLVTEVAGLPGQVVLLGHSMGALLAYETARLLAACAARPPAHLVVLGRGAPETGTPVMWPTDPDELVDAVASRYGGVPDAVRGEPELLRVTAGLLRADLELVRRYAWALGPPLDCPVTAVRGDRDQTTSAADLAAWSCHTRGDTLAVALPGGHFFRDGEQSALMALVKRRALR